MPSPKMSLALNQPKYVAAYLNLSITSEHALSEVER